MSSTRTFYSVITGLLALGFMVQAQETQGTPGVDYPNYDKIPKTSFSCSEQKYIPGLYADMETRCQVFHFCDENLQESFLCPPGMTFNQALLACDSWDNSNCSLSTEFYSMNSGPEMENARRNILMVLQLRNKSRSRPSIRPSDVYEKISSLYESTVGEELSKSPDLATVEVNEKSNDVMRYEVGSQGAHEEASKGNENNGSQLTQDLSGLDESNLNDEFTDISEVQYSETMEPEIFYDPVTEKYYLDYDSSQMVNEEPEDPVDRFNSFYNYGDFVKRYGLTYNELDEMQSDSNDRVNDIEEFNEMTAEEGSEKEFLKRMLDAERPPRRVRRRPLYAVFQEDDEVSISGIERGVEYPVVSSDSQFKTESVMTDSEVNEPEVSYEVMQELQSPNTAPVDNSEVPHTSEESEQDILSELLSSQINEHGFGRSFSAEEQNEESLQNDSHSYQTADEYSYTENVTPDDYESYSTDYTEVDSEIIGEPESEKEMRFEESNLYQNEESLDSETSKSDDTYVVIPDEYDSALEQYSETDGLSETYAAQSDSTDSYGSWIDFLPSYVSPAVYTPMGPYWLSVPPPYYPNEYGRQAPFTSENLFNSGLLKAPEYASSGTPNDQTYQYDFTGISPERYFPLDSHPYSYESPINFPEHAYDYGTEYGYPYANVYSNPYTGQFGYDTSEVNIATESSNLNEDPDFTITGNRDYSESEMQSWAQSYSTESSEIEEEMQSTESSMQTEDYADIYIASRTDGDSNVMPLEVLDAASDDMKEVETFYLFDFDEDTKEEFDPDNTDGVSSTDQLGTNELFQAEEPSRRNESFEGDSETEQIGSESESAEIGLEEFDRENAKSLHSSETVKSPRHNEDPAPLSVSGNLEAMNTPTTQSPRQPRSSDGNPTTQSPRQPRSSDGNPTTQSPRQPRSLDGNINLSSDPSILINRIYQDPNFRIQDALMAQSYSTEDISLQSGMEDGFFHRTGNAGRSRVPKLSEIQKRILSLKQGKFGTLSKYINSAGKKN